MVETVAVWAGKTIGAALLNAGASAGVAAAASAAAYGLTYVGVAVGTAYASQALVDTPDVGSSQGSLKQSVPPRIVAYGRGRLPGYYMLWEAQKNYAYDVVAFQARQAEAIEEVWSHDHRLTVGGDGWVVGSSEYGGGSGDLIHLETRLGLPTETAYPAIVAALGSIWTADHRGDGIASLGADYHHAKKENLLDDFPNGDPSWSAVGRWSLLWDPRDDSYSASSNTALQILDLLTAEDGLGQDFEATVEPVLDHWLAQISICDEPVELRGGGTVPRYQSFTYRALSDDPVECLAKTLAACDGRLLLDDEGCWKLWVGKVVEPTVTLTADDIHGYEVAGDASTEDVVNELAIRFKHEPAAWNMVSTDPWRDVADADARGSVQTQPFDLEAVTNNSQARRLAKREMARMLTPLRGTLQCKLSAARAMGERWVGVDFPELGLENVVVEVADGATTSLQGLSVMLPFMLIDPAIDEWDADEEEGDGPAAELRLGRTDLDAPEIEFVTPLFETGGVRLLIGTQVITLRFDLTWSYRWRVDGTSEWVEAGTTDTAEGFIVELETAFVPANEILDVQVSYSTGGNRRSAWSDTFTVDTALPTPGYEVSPPTALSATGGVGELTVNYRDPTQSVAYCIVRTNTAATLVGATAEAPEPPLALDALRSFELTRAAGSHYVWVTAYDDDDVPSATVGPFGPVTVT